RVCVRRQGAGSLGVPPCGFAGLPVLFVWRCHADRDVKFTVTHTDSAARRGTLELAHGSVETPAFMPVGTYGAVKAMSPEELTGLGTQIVLGNTFHLWLRPG